MAKKRHISKVNPLIAVVVRNALKLVFRNLFNVKLDLPDEIYNMKPPYVVLLNHEGFWDPFLAAAYLTAPIYYITSDAVFRYRFFGFLLKFFGAIPKTKSQSDLDALKHIFDMKETGRSIGIFPEGQRTWDGRTLPLIKSTSKLVRILKLPVVVVVFKGGFFSHPRWGRSIRKGELLIEYGLLFNGEEVGSMKVSDIHDRLTKALDYDEIEYQKQKHIEWHGGRYAENIEQFLFVCPSCGSFKGFSSRKECFRCRNCGKKWYINSYQEINADDGVRFDNLRDWSSWQLGKMRDRIDDRFYSDQVIFEDEGVIFHKGYKSQIPGFISRGKLQLTAKNIILISKAGKEIVRIPVPEVSGINVQNREVLDFYYHNALYTVRDPLRHFNAYKIWRAVEYLQREKYGMNLPD